MTKTENDLMFLDKDFQALINTFEKLNVDLQDELSILEIEKNNIRLELGSRKNVIRNEECDDSSVWGTLALFTSCQNASLPEFSKEDQTSHRAFET